MNDGQYTNIRNYLEEIAGNQKEILAELRRMGAPAQQARSAPSAQPWSGYDDMNVADVLAKAKTVDEATRARALAYERANKNRAGIVHQLVNWNS